MKIVFNTKSLQKANRQDEYFLQEVLKRLIQNFPEHEFILITRHTNTNPFGGNKNVSALNPRQPSQSFLLRKLWYDFKLPSILKKCKADVFVSVDGFCSLTSPLPQCLLLQDLTFFYQPASLKRSKRLFYNRYLSRIFNKAKLIATPSSTFKKELAFKYSINAEKIEVVYPAAKRAFLPLDEKVKEETKSKFFSGINYFLYTQRLHSLASLMIILKAFSIFKKRQKSNWKLVLTGDTARSNQLFIENLKSYKYRDDIVWTGMVEEEDLVRILGSAYALIHLDPWDGFAGSVLEAMNCHVPVMASAKPDIKEIAGESVLYFNSGDYKDLAEKMMLLYKDETLRNSLVEKAKIVAQKFNWNKTAAALWEVIQKAYSSSGKTQR